MNRCSPALKQGGKPFRKTLFCSAPETRRNPWELYFVRKHNYHTGGYLGKPKYSLKSGTWAGLCRRLCLRARRGAERERRCRNAGYGYASEYQTCSHRLLSACEHHNRIIRNLLAELAEKNLLQNEKLTHMGQRTTRGKLMSYLSAEAQRLGRYEFDIPFSRQQLADYLAVERSGLSLELGKMQKDGLLEFHKNHFVLKL